MMAFKRVAGAVSRIEDDAGITPRRWGEVDVTRGRPDITGLPDSGGVDARRNHAP
jgi:hypothetical protein